MDLIEALQHPPEDVRTQRPKLDVWMETRSEKEQAALRTAALDHAWMHTALRAVLVEAGAPNMSSKAVAEWRTRLGWRREH